MGSSFGGATFTGDVLTGVASGRSDAQIADELFISLRTVQKHLEHAYRKLGVRDRAAAAACVLGADTQGFGG